MADKDVIKHNLEATRKNADETRANAERAMDAAFRAFEEDLRRTWARTQAALAEGKYVSFPSIACEISNVKTRLDEALTAIQSAAIAAETARGFDELVRFDAACEAKKTPEDRMRESLEKSMPKMAEALAKQTKKAQEDAQIAEDLLDLDEQTKQAREMDREHEAAKAAKALAKQNGIDAEYEAFRAEEAAQVERQ